MIWIRRAIAVILGLILLVVLVAATVISTAMRVTDPAFLKAELVKVDAYGFLYDDVLDKAAGDAIEEELRKGFSGGANLPGGFTEFTFEDPAKVRAVLIAAVRETFPPEYTQEQVENALDELIPYMRGQTDEFALTPELDDKLRAAARAITSAIDELNLATQIIDRAIGPNLDSALGQLSIGGAQLNITPERARQIAHRIAPDEWVNAQIASALGEFVAWMTGDQDSFTVRIQFADRAQAARDEIKALLIDAEFTDFLFDTVIAPRLTEALGAASALSFGVSLTNDEVKATLQKVAPDEWVNQQLGQLIDVLAAYISGASNDLRISIPLADRRAATIEALTSLAESKLRQVATRLPPCGTQADAVQSGLRLTSFQLPTCVPPAVNDNTVVDELMPVVKKDLDQLIGRNFPQQIRLDRALLESQLGGDAFTAIDQARELIGGGFTWTDKDLVEALSGEGQEGALRDIENVRKYFRHDYAITQDDLRKEMTADELAQFDQVRSSLATALGLSWLLTVLLPLLLALAIAFLGGRRWWSRLAWGASALLFTSLVIWIAVSQAYSRARPQVHDELVKNVATEIEDPTARELALKAIDMVETVVGDLVAEASGYARNWTILGVLLLAGAIAWGYGSTMGPRRRATGAQGTPPAGSPARRAGPTGDA
jgi:sarcosine oxidase gamma subunit